jgi:hypothetical protein
MRGVERRPWTVHAGDVNALIDDIARSGSARLPTSGEGGDVHSPSVTLDTYGHLWPNAADRTRTAAQGLVDQVFGAAADGLRTKPQKYPLTTA